MSSLKQSVFWISFYLAVIIILAQFDYSNTPIIDFAKFFYFLVIIAIPVTLFFPFTSRINVLVPVTVWGSIYLVLLQLLDQTVSSPNRSIPIILLELILMVVGVWLAHQLAYGISHAESVMDAMALSAFPNRTQSIQEASSQIKLEITRSRRHHRPLSLLVLQADLSEHVSFERLISSVQRDLWNRFSFARIGQIIDEHMRQTDMLFRDRFNRFILLCPETDYQNSLILAVRTVDAIKSRTGIQILWGAASFPDDALNFEDLVDVAVSKLVPPKAEEIRSNVLK